MPNPTATLTEYNAAQETLFGFYNGLAADLTDQQMGAQSLCPDWSVRDVMTHTIGVDHMLTGWTPSTETPPPFDRFAAYQAEMDGLDRNGFNARIAEMTAARIAELHTYDANIITTPSFTPAGLGTYAGMLQIRVMDMWVHAHDISIPLGLPTGTDALPHSGFVAETALQEIEDAVGYIVGKKVGLPDGKSIVFTIRGGVERDIAVVVDGRAAAVDAATVTAPDAEVTADVMTFVMLAAGRIDPQEQIDAGTITWSGDAEWGETAARNLAYTR